ncbi:MAG: alpha/beta hydrolase [Candidatus Binatia bacterium]
MSSAAHGRNPSACDTGTSGRIERYLDPARRAGYVCHVLTCIGRLAISAASLLAVVPVPRFADRFVYFPTRAHDGGTPAALGLPYEDVELIAADGVRLHAWWVPAAAAQRTVLLLHGNAGNVSHRLDKLAVLNELDANALLLDYRGYGRSEGTPDEAGTYRDAEAAYDWLRGRGVAPPAIIAYGESLGGPIAVHLAAQRPLGGVVLESAPSSIAGVARHHYPWLPVQLLLSNRYDALAKIGQVRAPMLILHSPDDEIVPFAMAEALQGAAAAPVRLVRLSGHHNDAFIAAAEVYRAALRDFFERARNPLPM